MRWTEGLLVPNRVQLRATAGPAGARAARILFRRHRHVRVARVLARARSLTIATGLAPTCRPPVDYFDDLCVLVGVVPDGAAAMLSWKADRYILCLVAKELCVVVKVGHHTDEGLANEAKMLEVLAGGAGGVAVPPLRWSGHWSEHLVVVTEVLPLARGWREVTVNEALLVATELTGGLGATGPLVHGDLAPWNLLRLRDGLGLVDWEQARLAREPLFDLTHFVVTTASLLRRYSPMGAIALLTAPGSPGWLHLVSLGLDPRGAGALVERYLIDTADKSDGGFRSAMLDRLHPAGPAPGSPARGADRASLSSDHPGARQR